MRIPKCRYIRRTVEVEGVMDQCCLNKLGLYKAKEIFDFYLERFSSCQIRQGQIEAGKLDEGQVGMGLCVI